MVGILVGDGLGSYGWTVDGVVGRKDHSWGGGEVVGKVVGSEGDGDLVG